MTYHHGDYHLALAKLQAAPLTLTERDFDVLKSFNPPDEVRGREAVRRAQLALLTKAEAPLQTKAADPVRPASVPGWLSPERLGKAMATVIHHAVAPDRDRLKVLEEQSLALINRVQELEALTKTQAATLVDLSSENKALGQFIADTQRRPPSSDRTSNTKH